MTRHYGAEATNALLPGGVPFILWATALPSGTAGSLSPTFVSVRLVCLTVKLAYAFALYRWFPNTLSQPLGASVTF